MKVGDITKTVFDGETYCFLVYERKAWNVIDDDPNSPEHGKVVANFSSKEDAINWASDDPEGLYHVEETKVFAKRFVGKEEKVGVL